LGGEHEIKKGGKWNLVDNTNPTGGEEPNGGLTGGKGKDREKKEQGGGKKDPKVSDPLSC